MRYSFLPLLFLFLFSQSFSEEYKVGDICHSGHADFNYGGQWELSLRGNLTCNYWQFLGDDERRRIENQLNEYGEFITQHTDEDETTDDEIIDNHYQYIDEGEESDWDNAFEEDEEIDVILDE